MASPESVGIPSSAILAFLDAADEAKIELHSLMILRHGEVAAQGWWDPYRRDDVHLLYSLSKSFTSTAVGFAVSEGLLTVDDKVVTFFPEDLPDVPSENLMAMRVRDLLTMGAGNDADTFGPMMQGDKNWVRTYLSLPVPNEPGTFFFYNNGATYMLSAILRKLSGENLTDYLRPRLFDPLGIQEVTWQKDPTGTDLGATGLSITTESIAKFGQLLLQDGVWDSKRILPEGWVAEATWPHISNGDDPDSDWAQGYGYQYWRCRFGAFRGDGAFGQNCIVVQEMDAVFVTTARADDLQALLNLFWTHILPVLGEPLPEDPAQQEQLLQRLSSLKLSPPSGAASSPIQEKISGLRFRNEKGETYRFEFEGATCRIEANGTLLEAGLADYVRGETSFDFDSPRPVATWARWETEDTLVVRIQDTKTPMATFLSCHFGDGVRVETKRVGTFRSAEGPVFEGRYEP